VHRIRNLGEDLSRELKKAGIGDVPDMDTATAFLTVSVHKTSSLGDALQTIRLGLRKANLDTNATIERL